MIKQGQSLVNPYKCRRLTNRSYLRIVAAEFCLLKVITAAAINRSNMGMYAISLNLISFTVVQHLIMQQQLGFKTLLLMLKFKQFNKGMQLLEVVYNLYTFLQ